MFVVCAEFRRYIEGEEGTSIERQRIHKVFEPSATLAEIEQWVKKVNRGQGRAFSVSLFPEGETWDHRTHLTTIELLELLSEDETKEA